MDNISRLLTPNIELRNNLSQFIECFIEFYGEESRSEIEDKFSKMLPIAYITPEQFSRNLRKIEESFSNNLFKKILTNKNTRLTKSDLFEGNSLEYVNIQTIHKYQMFFDAFCLGSEGRKKDFFDKGFETISSYLSKITREEYDRIIEEKRLPEKYENLSQIMKDTLKYFTNEKSIQREYQKLYKDAEPLLKKIIPEINLSNFQDYLNDERLIELNKILEEYKKALESYKFLKSSLKKFYDKEKLINDSKQGLQEKYHKNFIREFKHLIPETKCTNLEDYLNGSKEEYTLDPYVKYFFGFSLNSSLPLSYFSSESENELNNEKTSNWKKDSIIEERIRFFKENGIDLENDYQSYLENEKVQEIWPSRELADSIEVAREKHLNNFNNEFYTTLPDHQKVRQEIDNLNLLNKDDSFDASIYTSSKTFVAPNIKKNNDLYELFSLLIISFDNDNFTDHFTVHELNHLYELYLDLVGENEYTVYCGWDIIVENITNQAPNSVDTTNTNDEKRPYELFNEIINELIAQEISKIMHNKNIHVFDNPKNAKYKNATNYEHSLFLVQDFFNEFRDKIIESRKNGNIQVIWNEVGKDNFDELNNLFKTYNEKLSGFRFYSLISDLRENKDTDLTRIYRDLVARKEIIMENMRKFQASKQSDYERRATA